MPGRAQPRLPNGLCGSHLTSAIVVLLKASAHVAFLFAPPPGRLIPALQVRAVADVNGTQVITASLDTTAKLWVSGPSVHRRSDKPRPARLDPKPFITHTLSCPGFLSVSVSVFVSVSAGCRGGRRLGGICDVHRAQPVHLLGLLPAAHRAAPGRAVRNGQRRHHGEPVVPST